MNTVGQSPVSPTLLPVGFPIKQVFSSRLSVGSATINSECFPGLHAHDHRLGPRSEVDLSSSVSYVVVCGGCRGDARVLRDGVFCSVLFCSVDLGACVWVFDCVLDEWNCRAVLVFFLKSGTTAPWLSLQERHSHDVLDGLLPF